MRAALGLVLGLAFAVPDGAAAETTVTADAFQSHIGTSTLTYLYDSGTIGSAQYGPDRTLVWAFQDDVCVKGSWYPSGDRLCFWFEDQAMDACWLFTMRDGALLGVLQGEAEMIVISEISRSDEPIACPGPEIGV